jgi:outer membrane biosynthesis protein TonB
MLVLAAGLAGCGGDDEPEGAPIPQQAATDLESRLDEVQRRMDAGGGACADIQNDTKPAVDSIVSSLPAGVDADVRDALQESFDRLFQLSEQDCDEQAGQETEPEPVPPPETETEETVTVPPPEETETVPPPEETETVPPPEEVPTEDEDNSGQGNGGGVLVPGEDG